MTASIPNAFERLRHDLELTDAQATGARAQKHRFTEELKQRLALDPDKQVKLSGSFRRRTSIRKLNDIDVLAVLDVGRHGELLRAPPGAAMELVADAIDAAYPNKARPDIQDHTVRIDFSGTGITFEVAPAFRRQAGGFYIPERSSDQWIETDPDAHRHHLTAANERAGGKLIPLVKIAKLWKRDQDVKITSFHLEMMACAAFDQGPPASYAEGLAELFDFCEGRVLDVLPAPGGIGPPVDARLRDADRLGLSKIFRDAAANARHALERGRSEVEEAHWLWRALIGSRYPERGTKPVTIAVAPDAPRSRFG